MRKLENSELDRKSIEAFKQSEKTPLILVLDDIRSLHNIGSVFRTADAFLIEKIYLCGITATPPNKEIHKTALGATETVAWEHQENVLEVIEKLKKENVMTLAIEQVESAIFLQNFEVEKGKEICFSFWKRSLWSFTRSSCVVRRLHRNPTIRHQTFFEHICKRRDCGLGFIF